MRARPAGRVEYPQSGSAFCSDLRVYGHSHRVGVLPVGLAGERRAKGFCQQMLVVQDSGGQTERTEASQARAVCRTVAPPKNSNQGQQIILASVHGLKQGAEDRKGTRTGGSGRGHFLQVFTGCLSWGGDLAG